MAFRHDLEAEVVNAFVLPEKRERYLMFLRSRRRRRDFVRRLYHFGDFAPHCVIPVKGGTHSVPTLIAELRNRGAGPDGYAISADPDLDGTSGSLEELIARVDSNGEGTIVCCIPGPLAYYHGEEDRFILACKDRSYS